MTDYIDRAHRVEEIVSIRDLLRDEIDSVLRTLSVGEQRVIELRFGLRDGKLRTLEEVGREVGITHEQIRQIEAKTFCKLRHPSRLQRLRERGAHSRQRDR
jgi:RNA polymerase primary sigma factor